MSDSSTPFGKDAPAVNSHALLEYLKSDHKSEYYYRGQTKYYDLSTPSSFRYTTNGVSVDKQWIELSSSPGDELPDRVKAKYTFKKMLLMVYGKVTGNLIAQQYGLSSDAFDLTQDPLIALFFATRSYPSYSPFEPENSDDLGVIYRFKINTRSPPPLSVMEHTLLSLHLLDEESGNKVWFHDVKSIRARILKGELPSSEIDNYLNTRFPKGHTPVDLYRSVAYIPYDFIESCFIESGEKLMLDRPKDIIRSSRTFRQKGGLYFPPTMHRGFVSKEIKIFPTDDNSFIADPEVAETLDAQRVYNLNSNPFVKKCFFVHDSSFGVQIEDEGLLWPSREEDYLLEMIAQFCDTKMEKYMEKYEVSSTDFNFGLLDPGYLKT